MLLTKVKGVAAVVLALAVVGAGGGALSYRAAGPARGGQTARLAARSADDSGESARQVEALQRENAELKAQLDRLRRQLEADRAKMKAAVDRAVAEAERALAEENKASKAVEFYRQGLNEKAARAKANPARDDRQRENDQLRDLAERYRVEAQKMQQEMKARQAALEAALAQGRAEVEQARAAEMRARKQAEVALAREAAAAEQARAQAMQAQKQHEVAQAQVAENTAKLKAVQNDGTRPAAAQKARDEVELLQAQLRIKQAELAAAKAIAEGAAAQDARAKALVARNAMSEGDYMKARTEATAALAQVRVKEAELMAAEVSLKQAMRRLEGGPGAAAAPGGREQRLKELDAKLDALRKEIQSLRQGAGPNKP
jgi:chromosome segregation ATPase